MAASCKKVWPCAVGLLRTRDPVLQGFPAWYWMTLAVLRAGAAGCSAVRRSCRHQCCSAVQLLGAVDPPASRGLSPVAHKALTCHCSHWGPTSEHLWQHSHSAAQHSHSAPQHSHSAPQHSYSAPQPVAQHSHTAPHSMTALTYSTTATQHHLHNTTRIPHHHHHRHQQHTPPLAPTEHSPLAHSPMPSYLPNPYCLIIEGLSAYST